MQLDVTMYLSSSQRNVNEVKYTTSIPWPKNPPMNNLLYSFLICQLDADIQGDLKCWTLKMAEPLVAQVSGWQPYLPGPTLDYYMNEK